MAYLSSADSNAGLANNLHANGIIHSGRVIRAMTSVDRADFTLPLTTPQVAYEDSAQDIGYGQVSAASRLIILPVCTRLETRRGSVRCAACQCQ